MIHKKLERMRGPTISGPFGPTRMRVRESPVFSLAGGPKGTKALVIAGTLSPSRAPFNCRAALLN
jgi:hypothetical protein